MNADARTRTQLLTPTGRSVAPAPMDLVRHRSDPRSGMETTEFAWHSTGDTVEGTTEKHLLTVGPADGTARWTDGPAIELSARAIGRRVAVAIFPAGWPFAVRVKQGPRTGIVLQIAPALLEQASEAFGLRNARLMPAIVRDDLVEHTMQAFLSLPPRDDRASGIVIDGLVTSIVGHVARKYMEAPAAAPRRARLSPRAVSELDAYITAHLDERLALEDLATVARFSVFHLSRAFKESTGLSPHAYVVQRRVERARDLLAGTRLSITEIALRCGFSQPSHFSESFRRHTGMTPRAYRTQASSHEFDGIFRKISKVRAEHLR